MKKYLFLMLAVLSMAVTFTACSSDDESTGRDARLVGAWMASDGGDEVTFNADGTVTHMEKYGSSIYTLTIYKWEGEWATTNDSKLKLHWTKGQSVKFGQSNWKDVEDAEERSTINYTISNNGKTLTLNNVEEEGYSNTNIYTKE